MMRITTENGVPTIVAETEGASVYLDNFAIIRLAKGPGPQRKRFIQALQTNGTLLLSMTNVIELTGPKGNSATAVRALLDGIGPCWVPLGLDPWKLVEREQSGLGPQAAISTELVEAYVERRLADMYNVPVVNLAPESFFALGSVVDWMQEDQTNILARKTMMDTAMRNEVLRLARDFKKDPTSLDTALPPRAFDQRLPGTHVFVHLLRLWVVEAKSHAIMPGDGLDFCHATFAAAYGSIVALDKHWKRRVNGLPDRHRLPPVYYAPELGNLISTLEALPPK